MPRQKKTTPDQKVIDAIQKILDARGGYVNIKKIPVLIGGQMREKYSLSVNALGIDTFHTLEPLIGDNFMFHKKGTSLYIMTPCEPTELVLQKILSGKATSPKNIARLLPFTRKEIQKMINMFIDDGRVKISFNEFLEPRISVIDTSPLRAHSKPAVIPEGYTQEEFKKAFDALDNGRFFVKICDIRKKLSWPREIFDAMLKNLRDKEIIQLHTGDASLMTQEEINDSFVDENNFRLGTVTWHVR